MTNADDIDEYGRSRGRDDEHDPEFDVRPKCEYCNDVLVIRGDSFVCPRGHYAEERPRLIY